MLFVYSIVNPKDNICLTPEFVVSHLITECSGGEREKHTDIYTHTQTDTGTYGLSLPR